MSLVFNNAIKVQFSLFWYFWFIFTYPFINQYKFHQTAMKLGNSCVLSLILQLSTLKIPENDSAVKYLSS